jgi:hypothetical protein
MMPRRAFCQRGHNLDALRGRNGNGRCRLCANAGQRRYGRTVKGRATRMRYWRKVTGKA